MSTPRALARGLLESKNLPVEKIGTLSRLGAANNVRHHFVKQVGVSPSDCRRACPPPPERFG